MSDLVRELVQAQLDIETLETQLKEAKKTHAALAHLVSDEFQASETKSKRITVAGKDYTVFRRRDFYCNVPAANRSAVVAVCRSLGMDDMVEEVVQTAGLKAWMREQVQGDDPADAFDWDAVPEELKELVSVGESVKAIVKKG